MAEKKSGTKKIHQFTLTLTPLTIVLLIIGGVFTLGGIITTLSNVFLIILALAISAILYRADGLTIKNVLYGGAIAGIIIWVINLAFVLMGLSWLTSLPFIGSFFIGVATIVSIFLYLIVNLLGGIVLVAFFSAIFKIIENLRG